MSKISRVAGHGLRVAGLVCWVLCWVLGWVLGVALAQEEWKEIGGGRKNVEAVWVSTENPQKILIGAKGGVWLSNDAGESWRLVLRLATTNHVKQFYFSQKSGNLYCILESTIYLSKDGANSWKKENFLSKQKAVSIAIEEDAGRVWVASQNALFVRLKNELTWQKVWQFLAAEEDAEEVKQIYSFAVSSQKGQIYLLTSEGILFSVDLGKTWENFNESGLLGHKVREIICGKDNKIYACTEKGVFVFKQDEQVWQEVSLRLLSGKINQIALADKGAIYAACEEGLFFTLPSVQSSVSLDVDKNEPSIKKVQEAAMRYAEAGPEKIALWRKKANQSAWLPELSVGIDRDTSELWHWEGGSTTKTDDDALRRGRDTVNWDINVSWDLSKIIWNDAEISIDVRSRLTAELREDILDQVTKLYFERLRVKAELAYLGIEDRRKRFEKEMRLKELSAYLDALTGGYFSSVK